ncbi:hypothetical protein GZ77_11555 [Endozoicomonas montiporae]|uniref:Lipoprotein n=1 Tax=Endozoicomonas montiporae TaxID=1027273 RepID=A0A081N8W8_9GAMM|nr:hypothetical protein GZ77_11555 [Endozoicomonas montiporae]
MAKAESKAEVRELDWRDLMPEPDPKVVEDYQKGKMDRDAVIAYLEKLGNTAVDKLDKTYGKMPGFLVPLNMDKNQNATELLLVPSAGACIHVPPPPPNQTIYIKYDKGIKVTEAGYTPYWVTGTLRVEKNTSEYTDTLYSIEVESIKGYF